MKKLSGLLAIMGFLSFGLLSPLAIAGGDEDKEKDKGKAVNVVIYGDDEKKDEGGK